MDKGKIEQYIKSIRQIVDALEAELDKPKDIRIVICHRDDLSLVEFTQLCTGTRLSGVSDCKVSEEIMGGWITEALSMISLTQQPEHMEIISDVPEDKLPLEVMAYLDAIGEGEIKTLEGSKLKEQIYNKYM